MQPEQNGNGEPHRQRAQLPSHQQPDDQDEGDARGLGPIGDEQLDHLLDDGAQEPYAVTWAIN